MRRGRTADGHGIHVLIFDHVQWIDGPAHAKALGGGLQRCRIGIGDSRDSRSTDVTSQQVGVHPADPAEPENTDSHDVHHRLA
jgi:hypothetical protein